MAVTQQMKSVFVAGAKHGSANIGEAVMHRFTIDGWSATGDECRHGQFLYAPPEERYLLGQSALVITLGATHRQPFGEQSVHDVQKVLYGSLELPIMTAHKYIRARGDKGGTIVFVGSYAHDHPFTHCSMYCAAKAGLDMAVRSLAWELTPRFKVFIVHPHHVQGTPMSEQILNDMEAGLSTDRDGALEYAYKDIKLDHMLQPTEVADMIFKLVDDENMQWLVGTPIRMYGGVR